MQLTLAFAYVLMSYLLLVFVCRRFPCTQAFKSRDCGTFLTLTP